MSSTGQATSPPPNFQLIIKALADYANLTGIDLTKNPFAEKIESSSSPEAILELLQEREKAFKEYREGNRRLISCLSPGVKVLHAFSGIAGEAVILVPFSPAKAVFTSIDVLLAAVDGVTSSYDAVLELFECLGNFLKRLEIYLTIPTTMVTDVIIKIMVELLSVLALATKQIRQGRFKKFAKKLLGEREVEAVLQKLDRLTQDEARMTVTQTLGVVHGLVGNVRSVMEDGEASTESLRQASVALHQVLSDINKMK
ncbi:hypothetical protein V8E52_007391, partial [Russula decolorans]